jgi:ribosome biogenesis GTPase
MKQTVDARVIAAFGRHLVVRTPAGEALKARPFGRALGAVCGDQVRCRIDPHQEVHAMEVLPRRNVLLRAAARGRAEAIVANLTDLFVVLAPLPAPELFVIDRYLAGATSAAIAATLVLNKADLPMEADLAAELTSYQAAGYPSLRCSATSGEGLETLRARLAPGSCAALVGQSGVGKSSILQQLVPEAEVAIGELMRDTEGRHTTTSSRLFELPNGAALIDSPGVRDFVPAAEALDARSLGFPEVERLQPACRFSDCRHMREPNCAVRSAVEDGTLSARRYESYRRLRRLREELSAARGPARGR